MSANNQTIVLELLFSGFFAVACLRASLANPSSPRPRFGIFLHMPGRLERLRRSRWQWFSLVALMLVLRLQDKLPLILEGLALLQFILFMSLPNRTRTSSNNKGRGNEAAVGNR